MTQAIDVELAPFSRGEHGRAAIKVIDFRGNEAIKILDLPESEA